MAITIIAVPLPDDSRFLRPYQFSYWGERFRLFATWLNGFGCPILV
jgi:hypothetical protein